MDKARYVEEGVRQLSQNKYYRKIESPVHTTVQETVNKIVDHIQLKKFLTKKQAEHLKVPHNPVKEDSISFLRFIRIGQNGPITI